MSTIPVNVNRVTLQMRASNSQTNLRSTNLQMLLTQTQLSTGRRVNKPSDDPTSVNTIAVLRSVLEKQEQRAKNINIAEDYLDNTDAALGEISSILLESQQIASSQIGVTSDEATRESLAVVIDQHIRTLTEVANREHLEVYLFGGKQTNIVPFQEKLGGLQYVGDRENLQLDLGQFVPIGVNSNGEEAFGSISARVEGSVDVDPGLNPNDLITNLNGTRGLGVPLGPINLTITPPVAAQPVTIDMGEAETVQDVVNIINHQIGLINAAAGSVAINGGEFELTANAGFTITVEDIGDGTTAEDLGVQFTATGATVSGGDVDPKVTRQTLLSDLNPPISAPDLAAGFIISNGTNTRVIDTSTATNVQDIVTAVEAADIGIRLVVNEDATGLDLVNDINGLQMSAGENGGTFLTSLGLRSLDVATRLEDFNNGEGVYFREDGITDIGVQLHDGTAFEIDLDGLDTVQDVIDAFNTEAVAAGVTVGALGSGSDFEIGFRSVGNGFEFRDNTVGPEDFFIDSINVTDAAKDLGFEFNAGAGSVIQGEDNATIATDSIFTHLMMLRDALRANDSRAITIAGGLLQDDSGNVAEVRAVVGIRRQRVTEELERRQRTNIQVEELLSNEQDIDFSEAISRFTQLETQLNANLRTSVITLQTSLLDFLR